MRTTNFTVRRTLHVALAIGAAVLTSNAEAILVDRGPDMVYDTVLDITWARDAGLSPEFLTWQQANDWTGALVLGGFDDWRLPLISASGLSDPLNASASIEIACGTAGGGDEVACRDNELGYMFYYNLQGPHGTQPEPNTPVSGDQIARGGQEIQNIYNQLHWSGTSHDSNLAWMFSFAFPALSGYNEMQPKTFFGSAWAVRTGDVITAVPEPATLTLLIAGFGALGLRRRRSGATA